MWPGLDWTRLFSSHLQHSGLDSISVEWTGLAGPDWTNSKCAHFSHKNPHRLSAPVYCNPVQCNTKHCSVVQSSLVQNKLMQSSLISLHCKWCHCLMSFTSNPAYFFSFNRHNGVSFVSGVGGPSSHNLMMSSQRRPTGPRWHQGHRDTGSVLHWVKPIVDAGGEPDRDEFPQTAAGRELCARQSADKAKHNVPKTVH